MSTLAQTAAGVKFYIGPQNLNGNPATRDAALLANNTWVEVAGITNIPQFGEVVAAVEHRPLNSLYTERLPGGIDSGNVNIEAAYIPGDSGQAAMRAALDARRPYNFKIEFNDNPSDGSPDAPSTFKFVGKVYSNPVIPGQRDNVIGTQFNVGIDGKVHPFPAE